MLYANAEVGRLREERDRYIGLAEMATQGIESMDGFAAGQQKGREECLEAVRRERLLMHEEYLQNSLSHDTCDEDSDETYSRAIDDAEQAILALPKVGE